MSNEIEVLNKHGQRVLTAKELVVEFYDFLQGNIPETISIGRGHRPKLSKKQAFSVIWYLQEHLRIIPDTIEQCWSCEELYDSNLGGTYWESKCRHYCGCCEYKIPENYDRGKR